MLVKGSLADFRAISRDLANMSTRTSRPLLYQTYCLSPSSSFGGPCSRSEYQGLRSFSVGARGIPCSVGAGAPAFEDVRIAIGSDCYSSTSAFSRFGVISRKRTRSRSSKRLICPPAVSDDGPGNGCSSVLSTFARLELVLDKPAFCRSNSILASASYSIVCLQQYVSHIGSTHCQGNLALLCRLFQTSFLFISPYPFYVISSVGVIRLMMSNV